MSHFPTNSRHAENIRARAAGRAVGMTKGHPNLFPAARCCDRFASRTSDRQTWMYHANLIGGSRLVLPQTFRLWGIIMPSGPAGKQAPHHMDRENLRVDVEVAA